MGTTLSTFIVNELNPDTLRKFFMLISENVDIKTVWPYVESHFTSRAQTSDIKSMKDLLETVIQAQDPHLHEDFMNALLRTYPNFILFLDQMQKHVSPTCSTSADYLRMEDNDDQDLGTNNKAKKSQVSYRQRSKPSTNSSSRTVSSVKSCEIITRELDIDRIFNRFGEELNYGHFVQDFVSIHLAQDTNKVLHGQLAPSKELFQILKRQIKSDVYTKFINYLNDKKPHIIENIFVDGSSPNYSRVLQLPPQDEIFYNEGKQDEIKSLRKKLDSLVHADTEPLESSVVAKETDTDLDSNHEGCSHEDCQRGESWKQTSTVLESKQDLRSRHIKLARKNMDIQIVRSYLETHFTVRELLIPVFKDPDSPLNNCFMEALLHTYPDLYDQMQQYASPSISAEKKMEEENDDDTSVSEENGSVSESWSILLSSLEDEEELPEELHEEPHVCLDFTKANNSMEDSEEGRTNEGTVTHIIQRVQELKKGSLLSFTLSKYYVAFEDASHLGRVLAQHIDPKYFRIENNYMMIESTNALVESITLMQKLIHISLCGQTLSRQSCECLRKSLQINSVLEELWLDNCKIGSDGLKTLSSVLNKDSLKVLSLNDNGFGDSSLGNLMDSLFNAGGLHTLCLERNGISDVGCQSFGQILAQIDTAFTLSLEGNQISDNGATALAHFLQQRHKMGALNLAENQIGNDGGECLVSVWVEKGFSGCLNLKGNQISRKVETAGAHVELCENKTGRERAEIIAARIGNGERFNCIELNGILLEDDAMEIIITALYIDNSHRSQTAISSGLPEEALGDVKLPDSKELVNIIQSTSWHGIAHLNVSNNALTTNAMDMLVELIKIDNLQSLDIGGNNFKSSDFNTLSEAVHGNKSLVALYLRKSNISDDGAFYMSMAMKNCMSLKHVDLAENDITGDGSTHNSDTMKVNIAVKVINMFKSFWGKPTGRKSGVLYLASALKDHATIQHLNLRGNKVYDTGLKQLLNALPSSSLQSLNISNNGIGPSGAELFLASMWKSNLSELDMSDNPIVGSVANAVHGIAWHLKRLGRKMKLLRLRNTEITDEAARNLMTGMQSQITIDIGSNHISDYIRSELKEKHKNKVMFETEEK